MDKNHGGDLQDVMVFVLQNETNVTTTIRAPQGRLKVDAQNKQLTFDLLNAQTVTVNPNGSVTISFFKGWSSYIYSAPVHGQSPVPPGHQRHDVLAIAAMNWTI